MKNLKSLTLVFAAAVISFGAIAQTTAPAADPKAPVQNKQTKPTTNPVTKAPGKTNTNTGSKTPVTTAPKATKPTTPAANTK